VFNPRHKILIFFLNLCRKEKISKGLDIEKKPLSELFKKFMKEIVSISFEVVKPINGLHERLFLFEAEFSSSYDICHTSIIFFTIFNREKSYFMWF
jgi:hypothetical protein